MRYHEAVDVAPHAIRVVICDDHNIFLEGFEALLKSEKTIQIVGHAGNGKELLHVVEEKSPDVVITDIQMPVMDGVEAARIIHQRFPQVGIIALSMYADESLVLEMLEAGAKGYLLKNTTKEEVIYAVKEVYDKGTYYCPATSNKLVRLMSRTHFHPFKQNNKPQFTDREIEIIRLMCQELCSKEIAAQLSVTCRVIESARERILEKTGAKNMSGIIVYAIKNGIFSVD